MKFWLGVILTITGAVGYIRLCWKIKGIDNLILYLTVILLIVSEGIFLDIEYTTKGNEYYLEAEVLATDTIQNTTVFTTEQGKYSIDGVYYDVSPYLLTMDKMGTKDNTDDDEILVVWKVME